MRMKLLGVAPAIVAMVSLLAAADARGADADTGAGNGAVGVPSASTAPTSSVRGVLGIGDRLKITFFEMIDIGAAQNRSRDFGTAGPLHAFFQRMDLSGEYTVDSDGSVSFPRLGRVQVSGRTARDVQAEIASVYIRSMGRQADVSITIVDRFPIYVLGPVKNPGAYKHVPGMVVLHAIALAGGFEPALGRAGSLIEGVREMERLRKVDLQFKRLLARRARLEAERNGIDTLDAPAELVARVGKTGVQAFMAPEAAILRAEKMRREQQQSTFAAAGKAARDELEALRRKLAQADVQQQIRNERLKDLQGLKDRGVTTTNSVILIRSELSDLEARRQDLLVAMVQVETRLAQAEQARAQFASEETAVLIKALAAVDQELAEVRQAMVAGEVLAPLMDVRATASTNAATYEIVRQTREGASVFTGTEISPLQPGDLLNIGIRRPGGQDGSDAGAGFSGMPSIATAPR